MTMTTNNKNNHGIVYSTEHGTMCPDCGEPIAECRCSRKKTLSKGDGIVRVGRETKGRTGKGVTIITGVPLDHERLQNLAKQLKQKCGAGGTMKDGVIEIQGDRRDVVAEELQKQGYKVKRTGA